MSRDLTASAGRRRIGAVDIHVGRRLRTARLAQRMSQEALADGAGVTFQQIQKYERGVNRIGAGRLQTLAKILQVPVTYFFEDLDHLPSKAPTNSAVSSISEALSTKEGVRIAVALSRIRNQEIRRRVADLLEAIIEGEIQPRVRVGGSAGTRLAGRSV